MKAELLSDIMYDMLHDAIHSLDYDNVLSQISSEPSPYFCQIFTTPLHTVEAKIPAHHIEEKR